MIHHINGHHVGHNQTPANDHHEARKLVPALERIVVPDPIIGAKGWLVKKIGLFLMAEGPGTCRAIACTHTGSGYFSIYDGDEKDPFGRQIFTMSPNVLGQYMLDMGFLKGLVFEVGGKMPPFATVTWMLKKIAPVNG